MHTNFEALERPYRLFVDGTEMKGTNRYCGETVYSRVRQSAKRNGICQLRIVQDYKDTNGKMVHHQQVGYYKATANTIPVVYHVKGDNPMMCPTQEIRDKKLLGTRADRLAFTQSRKTARGREYEA